ncbi:MAG: TldD protein [Phycisphaerae bacterium]|nr:MAG: TldD protein [Phycisphaerae bacterium]
MKLLGKTSIAGLAIGSTLWVACVTPTAALAADEHPLLPLMQDELTLSLNKLSSPEGTKPYFIQYAVTDQKRLSVQATLGALVSDNESHDRWLDVDLRCGDYDLDSTHQIRGRGAGHEYGGGRSQLALDGDPIATKQRLWLATDRRFKDAVKRLGQVKANIKVMVEEEDLSADFSKEKPNVKIDPWLEVTYDKDALVNRIRKYSAMFRDHPSIYSSEVTLTGTTTNELMISSEGSKLQFGRSWWRIGVRASTVADDGMELWQYTAFDAHSPDGLPDDAAVVAAIEELIQQVLGLREAPIVEPFTGPAILRNRASGVFFHEIFGHRIEGHRQKDVDEGQTFAKKIDQAVLPEFLSIVDDPSRQKWGDTELNGFYEFDQEAMAGQPVRLVDKGILKTFLLSRSPTRGFTASNGHGRRQPGRRVVARQGNLIVESTKQVPFEELRAKLIEEAKRQEKEYGLLFEDISGGFTTTQRRGPQAFKVLPIIVYKVYVDGRPDELVRGVDIVGTPLTCFSKILYTGDDPGIFNGVCGAESGSVPVSAISPSILVEQVEIEKKQKSQNRPPILSAPIAKESVQ